MIDAIEYEIRVSCNRSPHMKYYFFVRTSFSCDQILVRRGRRRNFLVERQRGLVRAQYATLFLLLSYLVLPGVSSIIFRTYGCVDTDPDGVTGSRQVILFLCFSIWSFYLSSDF